MKNHPHFHPFFVGTEWARLLFLAKMSTTNDCATGGSILVSGEEWHIAAVA